MPQPVCVKCKLFFRPKRNDVFWEEGMPVKIDCPGCFDRTNEADLSRDARNGGPEFRMRAHHPACDGSGQVTEWRSYKLWNSDLLECKGCGTQIIDGHGKREVAEHFQEGYAGYVESVQDRYYGRVDDC